MKLENSYLFIVIESLIVISFVIGLIPQGLDFVSEKEQIAKLLLPVEIILLIFMKESVQ